MSCNHLFKCPNCPEVMVKSQHGATKIRSKIMILKDDGVYGVCKGCNSEVKLPVTVTVEGEKTSNPPLFVKNYPQKS